MSSKRRRVLILGLDGATFDLIDPWARAGLLPNLSKLWATGARSDLRSTIQPVTAPAWTTFLTGVNQGKHGLYDFVQRQPGTYHLEVTNGTHNLAPTLFDLASRHGRRVIAVNVPYTAPPRPVNGIVVGGPFAPAVTENLVYPRTFFPELRKLVPDYFVLPDFDPHAADPMSDYAQKLLSAVDLRERLNLALMEREEWDLFMTVFMATDEVQHTYWHCLEEPEHPANTPYRDAILNVYRRIDRALGRLVTTAQEKYGEEGVTILVVSDHGAGPLHWMINLNHWLAEAGYLQFRDNRGSAWQRFHSAAMKSLAGRYRRHLSTGLRAAIRRRMGEQRFEQVKSNLESTLLMSAIDWDRTRAYALGAGGNLFVNLAGREPNGIIAPGKALEEVCQALSADLATLADPESGSLIVERVYRREELYHGDQLDKAPDLIIEWRDYGYWGRGRYDSRAPIFEQQNRLEFTAMPLTGAHRPEGILVAGGDAIIAGAELQSPTLLDMAPTVLALLGIHPPRHVDGRVISELLDARSLEYEIEKDSDDDANGGSQFDYSPEDAAKIADHLRSLGYL